MTLIKSPNNYYAQDETIALVQTLQRTLERSKSLNKYLNKTLERNEKALHESTSYRTERQESRNLRLAESMSHNLGAAKIHPRALPRRLSCSVIDERLKNESVHGMDSRISSNGKDGKTINHSASTNSPGERKCEPTKKERRKSIAGQEKLRTLVFRTLDRLFHMDKPPRMHPEIGLDTLKRLNENSPDTLPRDQQIFPGKPNGIRDEKQTPDSQNENGSARFIAHPGNFGDNKDDEEGANCSSSSDDDSWTYVPKPLEIQQVVMEDSLEYSNVNGNCIKPTTDDNAVSQPQQQHQQPRKRYLRKPSKSAKSKIRQRFADKQHEKEELPLKNILHPVKIPRPKLRRPDSPLQKRKTQLMGSRLPPSLPNLFEGLYDEDSTLTSDCGVETFTRGAVGRPSSTLSKSVPCILDLEGNNDENVCSAASSFSSLIIPEENDAHNELTTALLPSALCKNVHVLPITVPIEPWEIVQDVVELEEAPGVRHLSNKFIDAEDTKAVVDKKSVALKKISANRQQFGKEDILDPQENDKENLCQIDEISEVLNEFAWLEDFEDVSLNTLASNTIIVNAENDKPELGSTETEHEAPSSNSGGDDCKQSDESASSLGPPPPPLPPPMPSVTVTTTYRALRELPLTVFIHPDTGNSIFKNLETVQINEDAAGKLKENFPLKSPNRKSSKLPIRKSTSGVSKFKLNIEIFLKRWPINPESLLESITSLDTKGGAQEMASIPALALVIPRNDDSSLLSECCKNSLEPDRVDAFISALAAIPRLKQKLQCLQFSLEFKDATNNLLTRMQAFISACTTFNNSTKFMAIIKVVLGFLNELNQKGTEIYGFDIQSLQKLATRTSKDGTTTLLHFLIEYIMDVPSYNDCADFYIEFQDLDEVAKTPIKSMEEQYETLHNGTEAFKLELRKLAEEKRSKISCASPNPKTPVVFYKDAEAVMKALKRKLGTVKDAFSSCKQHFGLEKNDVTETEFFNSLSIFLGAYQRIHKEILDRKSKVAPGKTIQQAASVGSPLKSVVEEAFVRRRKSCGPVMMISSSSKPQPANTSSGNGDELDQCLRNFLKEEKREKRVRTKRFSLRCFPKVEGR